MSDYNIGNIYAELCMDITNLEVSKRDAIKELGKLRDEGEKILKEAGGKMTDAMKIRLDEIEKNKANILKTIDDLNNELKAKINPEKYAIGMQIESQIMQPLKAFANASVETFTQFQQSMQNTFSVMGASNADMKMLEESAKKMGETTRFSASQASQALYALGSAGQNATEAVNSLQGVLRLAGATGSDLAYTSETIASTLSQFNLEAGKASHIADVYAKAISKSQASMTKLSYSMKYVGPVASGLGISLETTTAALMKLYNTGYGGEQAGTYLKQAFQKLASGTNDLKTKLEELGISYEDVNPQTRNFADIINTLKEKNIGVTESIAIFGETAGGAMAKLIEEGGEAISTMEGLLKSSEGAASEMQEIQNASFANTKAELASAMEALQITTGSILEPALNTLAKGFTEILKSINGMPIGMQTFITTMLTASTAIVPLLTLPSIITKINGAMQLLNLTMLHNPIFMTGAVLSGIAALSYAIYQTHKKNTELMIQDATKGVDDIKEMYKKAKEAGEKGRNIQGLLSQYETLKDKTNKTKEEQEAYNQTLQKLTELVPNVVTGVNETGEAYIQNIEKIKQASREQLLLEQQKLAEAEVVAEKRATIAETVKEQTEQEIEANNFKLEKYSSQIEEEKRVMEAYKKAKAKGKKALEEFFMNVEIDGSKIHKVDLSNEAIKRDSSFEEDQEAFFKRLNNMEKKYSYLLDEGEKLKKRKEEAEKTIQDLSILKTQKKAVDNQLTPPELPKVAKRSKKEIIAEMLGEDGTIKKAIEQAKKEAKKYAKSLDEVDEEMKIIQQRLKEIYGIKAEDLVEGEAFNEKDAEPLLARYRKLEALKNAKNAPKATPKTTPKKEVEEFKSFMDEVDEEYRKKKEEFDFTIAQIMALKTELEELKTKGENTKEDIETIDFYQNTIETLQKKAKSLSEELGKDFILAEDIDKKIAELDQKDTNSFKAKFKAIREAKEATIKAITDAQTAGNIDEKTANEKIKKINSVALKSTITVGAELSKTILSVGNNVTDIILGAIEKGTLSLSDALNLVSQIGGQLAEMIPDPVTKAVIGAVQMGINLISKIVNYVDNKANKYNEERAKAREDEEKRSQDEANKQAGDTALRIAKQTDAVKQGFVNYNKMMNDMSNRLQQNHINDVLQKMGEKKSLASETRWDTRIIEEGWFFGLGKKVPVGWERYHYEYQFTINELAKKIQEARKKGDTQLEKKLQNLYKKSIEKNLKDAGINTEELNGFHNYLQGLENVFVDAVRNKDFSSLRDAMKEKIREAMWAKLQKSIILSRLKPLFMELEKAGFQEKEKIIDKIMKEGEDITKELENYSQKVFGELGGVPTELEEHRKAWRGLKESIKEALSSSLGDAAYNADWASFKKAFANEMKKAIISATVANAGLKTKIDTVIKDIMKDNKITQEEINSSIDVLQDYFDELEGKLAPLAKITNALEGGVDVKSQHAGTIIQQLSGADRDFFAEEFRKNFANMGDTFKSAMIDLKEIHQAKITVEMATLSVNDIYINASEGVNLKELIAELLEEARRG